MTDEQIRQEIREGIAKTAQEKYKKRLLERVEGIMRPLQHCIPKLDNERCIWNEALTKVKEVIEEVE